MGYENQCRFKIDGYLKGGMKCADIPRYGYSYRKGWVNGVYYDGDNTWKELGAALEAGPVVMCESAINSKGLYWTGAVITCTDTDDEITTLLRELEEKVDALDARRRSQRGEGAGQTTSTSDDDGLTSTSKAPVFSVMSALIAVVYAV